MRTSRLPAKEIVYTTNQIANLCGVAPRTAAMWVIKKKLPGYVIPGSLHRRVHRTDLLQFLRHNKMSHALSALLCSAHILLFGFDTSGIADFAPLLPSSCPERIIFTTDNAFEAGAWFSSHKPGIIVVDFLAGSYHAFGALSHATSTCPILKRIALVSEDWPTNSEDAARLAPLTTHILRKPYDPRELARLIISPEANENQ